MVMSPDRDPDVFGAISHPARRRMLDLLLDADRSVNAIAGEFQMSRPAVSQHLRVLEGVGLVTHRRNGTRHLYELDAAGVAVLRDWVDGFWTEALARFKQAAEQKGESS